VAVLLGVARLVSSVLLAIYRLSPCDRAACGPAGTKALACYSSCTRERALLRNGWDARTEPSDMNYHHLNGFAAEKTLLQRAAFRHVRVVTWCIDVRPTTGKALGRHER
jgi:hypothetical protein